MMLVVGPLVWIARQVNTDLCYKVSRLKTHVRYARRYHLKEANKVIDYAVRVSRFTLLQGRSPQFRRCVGCRHDGCHLGQRWNLGKRCSGEAQESAHEARGAWGLQVRG